MNEIDALYQVASDFEAEVLDDLRHRAGLVWICGADRWRNPTGEGQCGCCGKPRAVVEVSA